MRTILLRGLVTVAVAIAASPAIAHAKLSTQDIIKMTKAGLPESVILATIKASDAVFELKATDIIELHKAGVTTKVLEAMMATVKKKAAEPAKKEEPRATVVTPPATSRAAEEDRRAEERREREREEARRAEERRRRVEEDRRAEEGRRAREEERRRAEEDRKAEERRRAREEELRRAERERREREREEARRAREERRRLEERRAEERRRLEEERRERERRAREEEELRRREEEERRREEARRRAERERRERERRREAERRRLEEKHAVFSRAKNLGAAGQHLSSAAVFYEYLTQLAQPATQEYYDAEYFLARQLHEGGLGQAAIPYLTSIVERGPRDPNFRRAFRRLRVLSDQLLVTSPRLMEKLSGMSVSELPRGFRDEFNYTLGKFYNRWGNFTRAMRFLEQVSETSEFFASAAYLRGLILLRDKKAKSAHEMFKKAVLAAEKSPGRHEADLGVLELGYLALARLAYEVGGYKAAIFYYDKIPHTSTKLGQALFEKAWTHFQNGNYSLALGTFHGLHTPYFADRFHPDLYILEATVYLNMCHATMAKELVELFQKRYGKLHKDLKALLARVTSPEALFQMFLATGERRAESGLPVQLYSYVLQDAEFADLVAALKDYDKQRAVLEGLLARASGPAAKLWASARAAVEARRERLYRSAGLMIRKKLQRAEQELGDYLIKADEIMFETINAEKEQLDREATALMKGVKLKEGKVRKQKEIPFRWDRMHWEYTGEVWADEVDSYRSLLEDGCKR